MTKRRQQLIHKKRLNLNGSLPADIINNAYIFLVHLYKPLRFIECENTTKTFTFSKSLLAMKRASCTAISLLCYMTIHRTIAAEQTTVGSSKFISSWRCWRSVLYELNYHIQLDLEAKKRLPNKMDDTELTYKFWRIRKTVMQVIFAVLFLLGADWILPRALQTQKAKSLLDSKTRL